MKKLTSLNKGIKYIVALFSVFFILSSCEDDFTTVGGDFINNLDIPEPYVVQNLAAYSDNIQSVQTNSLDNYLLGKFSDPVFGDADVSILSQFELERTNPNFGENPVLDSVVLTLPLFSQITGRDEETNKDIYRLDSVFGEGAFKLGIYESNQFLSDIDPGENGDFDEPQIYYSDQLPEIENNIIFSNPLTMELDDNGDLVPSDLSPIIDPLALDRTQVLIDYSTTVETEDDEGDTETEFERIRVSPRIRIKLDPTFFEDKILNEQSSLNLASQSSFKNFLRGFYIKADQVGPGNVMVNFDLFNPDTKITLYYRSQRPSTNPEEEDLVETFNEFDLNFAGNTINFYDDSNGLNLDVQDSMNGEENVFIQGGEGIVTIIDPFNGPDLDNNGVADEIDVLRQNNWLVNEANIILYIDEELANEIEKKPLRIFAYDIDRNRVLIDYNTDEGVSANPLTSKLSHLGPLIRPSEDNDVENSFYKIRITSHINNIINNDSTNTRIGVVVTENVNQARRLEVRESEQEQIENFIESTISTPRGTVFHGNLSSDENLRLKLQIYYTEPN